SLLHFARAELRNEHRRAQSEWHGNGDGQGGNTHGADNERTDAELEICLRSGEPLSREKKLSNLELGQKRRTFAEDEEEDAEDKDDGTDAAEVDQCLDDFFRHDFQLPP